jgi:hypothetical protein
MPPRERLREMGSSAAKTPLPSWDDTAQAYLTLCQGKLPVRVPV